MPYILSSNPELHVCQMEGPRLSRRENKIEIPENSYKALPAGRNLSADIKI